MAEDIEALKTRVKYLESAVDRWRDSAETAGAALFSQRRQSAEVTKALFAEARASRARAEAAESGALELQAALTRISHTTDKTGGFPSGKWHGICVEIAEAALARAAGIKTEAGE